MSEALLVTIDRLVHGGQAIATAHDGKKIFVWNALPGETVKARVIKKRRHYDEALAEKIITAAPERIEPREANFLATSPWQIMHFDTENQAKRQIALDVMAHEGIELPDVAPTITDGIEYGYRNKMEYSFWGDDDGLHLALHMRGSKGKHIIQGSALALPAIDRAAEIVRSQLDKQQVRAGGLKTVVVRATQDGHAAVALYVKDRQAPDVALADGLDGIRVYYSDPRSPASVATELLHEAGDVRLQDKLLGNPLQYDVDSFFQVNLPVFELALADIKQHLAADSLIDMYAGVGSIGLNVAGKQVTLVELDPATGAMAAVNAEASALDAETVLTSAEASLEHIKADTPLIVDPPRAGLHLKVTSRIAEVSPPKIAYLSCNPATQARDLASLAQHYKITHFSVYNFFPRTPHIETLAILERR